MTRQGFSITRFHFLPPERVSRYPKERALWHETPEEVKAGLKQARERARLFRWVRRQMARKLTPRERRCVELYFLENLTFREAAERTGTNASSVYRAVRRSLRKLRLAAQQGRPPISRASASKKKYNRCFQPVSASTEMRDSERVKRTNR